MDGKVGSACRLWGQFIESGVGKTGLTVTVDLETSTGLGSGLSATAGNIDGFYYYDFTPTTSGWLVAAFKTATTTVDQMHIGCRIDIDTSDSTPAGIADAVWDEALSGHISAGSAGLALGSASTGDVASIADAVWDEALSGHTSGGSAGAYVRLISAGKVTVVSPISTASSTLTLIRSNDYLGTELGWSSTGWWDLTGATSITLTVRRRPGSGTDSVVFAVEDSSTARVAGDGVEQSVYFNLAATDTASIEIGDNIGKYDIELISSGYHKTLVTGLMSGVEDQTRTT